MFYLIGCGWQHLEGGFVFFTVDAEAKSNLSMSRTRSDNADWVNISLASFSISTNHKSLHIIREMDGLTTQ
jgi:hypothetical protein